MAWFGLAATIAWNYHEYRHGRPTICAITRRTLPRPAFLAAGLAETERPGELLGYLRHYPESAPLIQGPAGRRNAQNRPGWERGRFCCGLRELSGGCGRRAHC